MESAVKPPEDSPSVREYKAAVDDLQARHIALAREGKTSPKQWEAFENHIYGLMNRWPDSPHFVFALATFALQHGRAGLSIALINHCITLGVRGAEPLLNLAAAYKLEHADDKAEEFYLKAVLVASEGDKDPASVARNKAAAFHGLASLYVNRGMPERCLHWSEKALACVPDDRFALWNKGLALLESGDFGPGFDLYDSAGFMTGGEKPMDRKLKTYGGRLQRWTGEKGRHVVCYGEQGVGDELMFFSMLPDLIRDCASVVVECDPRIDGLIRNSFPGVAVYTTSGINDPFDWLDSHPEVTHFVPCGSLGRYYRRTAADFPKTPYFKPEPWLVEKWGRILADYPGPKVALSWAGGLKKTRQDKRSVQLDVLRPILEQDATFFSLQYHPQAHDDCARVGADVGKPIHSWGDCIGGPEKPGYSDTAAFLQHMDLVITPCTSLVHLCGSLGTPTICMVPKYAAWRYGASGPNAWYGSVEQIRQVSDGDWTPVIEAVADRVAALSGKVRVRPVVDAVAAEPAPTATPEPPRKATFGANATPKQKRERRAKSKQELKRLRKIRGNGHAVEMPA